MGRSPEESKKKHKKQANLIWKLLERTFMRDHGGVGGGASYSRGRPENPAFSLGQILLLLQTPQGLLRHSR